MVVRADDCVCWLCVLMTVCDWCRCTVPSGRTLQLRRRSAANPLRPSCGRQRSSPMMSARRSSRYCFSCLCNCPGPFVLPFTVSLHCLWVPIVVLPMWMTAVWDTWHLSCVLSSAVVQNCLLPCLLLGRHSIAFWAASVFGSCPCCIGQSLACLLG